MVEPLRIGLVGCGMIGQIHADGLAKLAADGLIEAVAAADPSSEARAAVARNCAFARFVDDGFAVIADPEVEAVLITTPTVLHRDLVLAAVDAGKPLLCEKPLAATFDVVAAMTGAVVSSGLVAQVGFHSRFHPLFQEARRLATSGELGAPMGYVLRDDQYWPTGAVVPGHSSWRSERAQAGGGALLEHSIHAVDVLCWCFGPAVRVHARTRSVFGFDVEDTAALVIEHESGVVGTLLSVFNGVRGREERRLEVFCTEGAMEVTSDFTVGAREDSIVVQRPDARPERPDVPALREASFVAQGIVRRDFVFYQYASDLAWVRAVRAGQPASPDFTDARRAHAAVDAAYRAAAAGEAVEVVAG